MNLLRKTVWNLVRAGLAIGTCVLTLQAQVPDVRRIPVIFTGGHETDPRDHGRPDVLIAAALGVPTEVFREAFSHVTPARGGQEPDPAQVQRNKAALMRALGPYGIDDERINQVSNYYRYNRSQGQEVWRCTPAEAYATVRNGVVVGFTVTSAGSGYSSAPHVSLQDLPDVKITATISFQTDFAKNGSIKQITTAGTN